MDEEAPDDGLSENWLDRAVAAAKGAAGLVPLVGGPLAEVIGTIIPGQRSDRIAIYLRELSGRLNQLDTGIRERFASTAERIDLIEEGGYQAARATSSERIQRIVTAVHRGLSEEDANIVRRKRLLVLLGELDDDELGLLKAYGEVYHGGGGDAFEKVNQPYPVHMKTSRDEIERNHLYDLGKNHLIRLGLIKKRFRTLKRGEAPEFDSRSGDFKHSIEISELGLILLRNIGLLEEDGLE